MKKVISTTDAPAAIGPYSQAIEANGMIFLSGMLPIDPATGEFASDNAKGQTEQIFKNIKALLSAAGLTVDNIVKTTVFLDDMSYFAEMNEVYAAQFNGTFPARSALAVQTLPKNALVEIEVIAMK
jgi:2-iminobutanoate/2-iminopropanoate deaminase